MKYRQLLASAYGLFNTTIAMTMVTLAL